MAMLSLLTPWQIELELVGFLALLQVAAGRELRRAGDRLRQGLEQLP